MSKDSHFFGQLMYGQLINLLDKAEVLKISLSGHGEAADEFCYKDRWAEFRVSLRDSTLAYAVRDSVTTIVFREYKHHFLWWRWGTKGYRVKVANFNPHSTLLYNQYIKVDR